MKIWIPIAMLMFAQTVFSQVSNHNMAPKVAVWDTYVTRHDGRVMHFDIIAPADLRDTAVIYGYGREYLKSKGQEGQRLSAQECRFCHVRQLHPAWAADIRRQGYYILELENCD